MRKNEEGADERDGEKLAAIAHASKRHPIVTGMTESGEVAAGKGK